MDYKPQVSSNHYSFGRYYYPGRWISYWHETNEILSRDEITSVLDVGPGSDLLKNILKTFSPDIVYKTADIASDLHPDYLGSATNLPIADNVFDVVCAFQVLEHIEFKDFEVALQELKRVSKKYVFLSLPHFGPSIEIHVKIPLLPRLRFATKIPWPRKHLFAGQHYWEIGKKGYSRRKIRSVINKYFIIENEYVPFEHQYHRFFILRQDI